MEAAPSTEEARHLRKGVKLREAGDEYHAVVELQKAYDIAHSPRAAGQLGLSEWALGRWVDAESHVTEALKATDDPFLRDKQRRQVLEQALNTIQSHLGTVEIAGEPQGAEVVVAGRIVGKFPLAEAIRAASGPVEIEISATGFETERRTLQLAPGQYLRVLIRLKPPEVETASAPAPTPTPASPPLASPSPNPSSLMTPSFRDPLVEETAPEKPARSNATTVPRWRIAAKWSAFVGALGMLGFGIGENVYYSNQKGRFNADCERGDGTFVKAQEGSNLDNFQCRDLSDSYLNAKRGSIIGYIGAGVLTATWLTLWLTEPGPSPTPDVAWSCAPTISAVGMACAFHY